MIFVFSVTIRYSLLCGFLFSIIMVNLFLLVLIGFLHEPFTGAHEIENQGKYVENKFGSVVGADLV